jgi:hypothetical protein
MERDHANHGLGSADELPVVLLREAATYAAGSNMPQAFHAGLHSSLVLDGHSRHGVPLFVMISAA